MPIATIMNVTKPDTETEVKGIRSCWTKCAAVFPHASCEGHSACSVGTELYVFGGVIQCEGIELQECNDLYKLDIHTQIWLLVESKGDKPTARCNATMSAVGPVLYLFGGLSHTSGWFNDFYSFHTESCIWTKLQPSSGVPPSPRDKLASATISHNIYFFGGFGPKSSDSLEGPSIEEEGEWSDDEEDVCGDIEREQEAAQFGWFNDLHIYNTVDGSWSQPMQLNLGVPTQRAAHTLTPIGKQLVVFGGRDSLARCNDLHIYNTETRKWDMDMTIIGDPPYARSFHSSAAIGRWVVVVGGRGTQNQHYSDVHVFHTDEKRWSEAVVGGDAPCGRGTHSCHTVGDKLVLFGGSADYSDDLMQCQSFYTDTYLLNTADLLPDSLPTKGHLPSGQ